MKTQWRVYKELELIPDPQPKPQINVPKFKLWLREIWQAVDVALFRDLEPRVWQSLDRAGRTCWHVYDPKTGQILNLDSGLKVRLWLEQLFYYN